MTKLDRHISKARGDVFFLSLIDQTILRELPLCFKKMEAN